jgi:hypothetical protein
MRDTLEFADHLLKMGQTIGVEYSTLADNEDSLPELLEVVHGLLDRSASEVGFYTLQMEEGSDDLPYRSIEALFRNYKNFCVVVPANTITDGTMADLIYFIRGKKENRQYENTNVIVMSGNEIFYRTEEVGRFSVIQAKDLLAARDRQK